LPVSGYLDGAPAWGWGGILGVANGGDKLPDAVEINLVAFVFDRTGGRWGKIGKADRDD